MKLSNSKRIVFIAILCFISISVSETISEKDNVDNVKDEEMYAGEGFYLALPAYLFKDISTIGLQAGYQFKKLHLRIDLSTAEDFKGKETKWFAVPSIGIFYIHNWHSKIKVYEGITIGLEKGLKNSFKGETAFINAICGIEILSAQKHSFFIEFGSGFVPKKIEGAFNGGTIIGGGVKRFFKKKK